MKNKLLTIVNHYGIRKQLKYFQSEVFELTEAVIEKEITDEHLLSSIAEALNYYFYKIGSTKRDHVAEEIADVLVMLEQIRLYYGIDTNEIKEVMEYKVDRQLQRIEDEKNEKKR